MPGQLTASLVLGGKAVTSIKVPVEGAHSAFSALSALCLIVQFS